MRSVRDWWRAQRRPLSARGHLYGMAFWLLLAGLAIYRMLATNRDLTLDILFLAAVLLNLGFLLLSYRNISRVERHPSPEGDVEGLGGATDVRGVPRWAA